MSVFATIEFEASGGRDLPPEMDPAGQKLIYGQCLPYAVEKLDEVAKELGVLPLSTFFDDSDMLTDEERAEVGLPPAEAKWSDPRAGLRTVKALVAALEREDAGKSLAPRVPVEAALWDLRAAKLILEQAVGAGGKERFRISVL